MQTVGQSLRQIIRPSFDRIRGALAVATLSVGLVATPVLAQIQTVDPNTAIDADLAPNPPAGSSTDPYYAPAAPAATASQSTATYPATPTAQAAPVGGAAAVNAGTSTNPTWHQDDLIGAAEGVFGKGAKGLAGIIERTLKDQGEPVAYITGREASGAIAVGLRYGSGTMFHKVEGQRTVYWTGPSVGFDLGGNAANTFVLVYNLHDSQDLYKRFPAGEGAAYFVGGFNASYLRWGNVVLIPIRLGVGYRLGANIGYMKFSEKRDWLPF